MGVAVLAAVFEGAASDIWAGVVGLVVAGIGAATTAAATVAYARRSREALYAVKVLEEPPGLSWAELEEAVHSLWRQREVLTRALAESEPGETSMVLAEQLASLDRRLAPLLGQFRHARASAKDPDAGAQGPGSPAGPHGDA